MEQNLAVTQMFAEATKDMDIQQVAHFLESLAQLELQLEDQSWSRMGMGENQQVDFSPSGRKSLQQQSLLQWMKSPLIARAIEIKTVYVFNQVFQYTATDEGVQTVLDLFMKDDDNRRELTTLNALHIKSNELQIYGNLYFVFFVNEQTGQVKVRSIPDVEIADIICDPEDGQKPLLYKRVRKRQTYDFEHDTYKCEDETLFYRDWKAPEDMNVKVPKGKLGEGLVMHVKVNCLTHSKFGVPELYRAFDWNRAYVKFLEDLASVWAALSKFAWKRKVQGGPAAVTAQKTQAQTALAALGASRETNPSPAAGSTWIENGGVDMQPIKTSGATLDADSGRRLLLQVCAASGIPEPLLTGDPSTSNLATTEALMGPTIKGFSARQELWKDIFSSIFDFIIDMSIKADGGIIQGHEELDSLGSVIWEVDSKEEVSRNVDIQFPEMVDTDIPTMIKAVTEASGTALLREEDLSRILLNLLDVDGVDEILLEMYPKDEDGNLIDPDPHGTEEDEDIAKTVEKMQKRLDSLTGVKPNAKD